MPNKKYDRRNLAFPHPPSQKKKKTNEFPIKTTTFSFSFLFEIKFSKQHTLRNVFTFYVIGNIVNAILFSAKTPLMIACEIVFNSLVRWCNGNVYLLAN